MFLVFEILSQNSCVRTEEKSPKIIMMDDGPKIKVGTSRRHNGTAEVSTAKYSTALSVAVKVVLQKRLKQIL